MLFLKRKSMKSLNNKISFLYSGCIILNGYALDSCDYNIEDVKFLVEIT
jgi:hypothetical protein